MLLTASALQCCRYLLQMVADSSICNTITFSLLFSDKIFYLRQVSVCFKGMKQFVSRVRTLCSKGANTLFLSAKHFVSQCKTLCFEGENTLPAYVYALLIQCLITVYPSALFSSIICVADRVTCNHLQQVSAT